MKLKKRKNEFFFFLSEGHSVNGQAKHQKKKKMGGLPSADLLGSDSGVG